MPELDPQIAVGLIGFGIALAVWAVGSQSHEKSVVRETLRSLDDYEVDSVRDQELLDPLTARALMPVLGALTSLGRRFTPVGYIDGIRNKFILSGRPHADEVDRFLALRVVTVALIPVAFWFAYIWNPLGVGGLTQIGLGAVLMLLLLLGVGATDVVDA